MAALSKRRSKRVARPSHIRADGRVTMVDVGSKVPTERFARARASVRMSARTEAALRRATLTKGDAFVAAQLAGIMAAKQTAALIPLTHPLALSNVSVEFDWTKKGTLQIDATARTTGPTGVEMEALCAVAIAALTIYDMIKALERGVRIESLRLVEKRGGKSGAWGPARQRPRGGA